MQAAQELVAQARRAFNRGDEAEATKYLNQSLKINDSEEGRALRKHMERWGKNSIAAGEVRRTPLESVGSMHLRTSQHGLIIFCTRSVRLWSRLVG